MFSIQDNIQIKKDTNNKKYSVKPFYYTIIMTKKDFFSIIIRLFGLYTLIGVLFNIIPVNISFLWEIKEPYIVLSVLFSIIIPVVLFLLLIFKANKIVSLLHLVKGFDTYSIDLAKLDTNGILKISIIIIGGLLFIDNLPIFIKNILSSFDMRIYGGEAVKYTKFNWVVAFLKTTLGYLFIRHHDNIAQKMHN